MQVALENATTKLSRILEIELTVFYFWKFFDSAPLSTAGLNPTISGMYYFNSFAQIFSSIYFFQVQNSICSNPWVMVIRNKIAISLRWRLDSHNVLIRKLEKCTQRL